MNMNKNRLDELIESAVVCCENCPINETSFCKLNVEDESDDFEVFNCADCILEWLQEFNVADALEEGTHIVNDQTIFPPESIPYEPCYGTPCEEINRKGNPDWYCEAKWCNYADCCPYA